MIFESGPWRRHLLNDATVLERWVTKPYGERRGHLIEKKVFVSAYAMRRLLQSFKLSTSTKSKQVNCLAYKCIKPVTWRDKWDFFDNFDFSSYEKSHLSLAKLLNLIIHSYLFIEVYEESSVEPGFLVTSDKNRNRSVWQIAMADYISLIRFVANDHPPSMTITYDTHVKDWVIWAGNKEDMPSIHLNPPSP